MREIAHAGIDTVIVSWWGWGSLEDGRLTLAVKEARAAQLRVAVHLEPWPDVRRGRLSRRCEVLQARGLNEFYVYDSTSDADADWAAALATVSGAVVYANTSFIGKALRGGFDGRLHVRRVRALRQQLLAPVPAGTSCRPALRAVGRPRVRRLPGDG